MKTILIACMIALSGAVFGSDYTYIEAYSEPGTYEIAQPNTEVVLSGEIGGNVTVTLPENCRVTLSNATIDGILAIEGNAELWLEGENAISTTEATAVSCSGALTTGGDGTLAATAAGAKKTGVVAAGDLNVAGGTTTVTILNPTKKNACGVSLTGNYVQTAGTLRIVGASGDYKQNGVFLASKNTAATISGGTLDVTLAGEKSVGLALDKATANAAVSGGTLKFAMSGDGAKGVKGDGLFTMTGGSLEASLSGGATEDYFEYEDGYDVTWNYYVTLTSDTKTSGGTATYNTTALIENGTYPVMDPSKCYAVKVGTLEISDGAITVVATGTAGRGLGADNMTLSGGTYDITVSGGPTEVYVESLVDSDDLDDTTYASGVPTCLDSGGAACIKTSGETSLLTISGGTFNLKATGNAGKLINAAGYLVIGTEGQKTLPTDTAFSPDISGSTTGEKVYCTAVKQKYYGVLATAEATTDIGSLTLSVASENLVQASSGGQPGESEVPPDVPAGDAGGPPDDAGGPPDGAGGPPDDAGGPPDGGGAGGPPDGGGQGGPDGAGMPGGGDDDADYSNPKGIKGYAGMTIHGGRITVTTVRDGGEGLESKNDLAINGGVLDLQCYDDCINSGGNLVINGGYLYALSSGNDAIDSNANIYMTGGVVFALSTAGAPEVGIDVDNAGGLVISGGHLIAIGGAAGNMVVGSSGSQKTYVNTSVSAAVYSGKYLSVTGTQTFTAKIPALSGAVSLVCTTEGWASAGTPKVSASAPASGSLSFHDLYLSEADADDSGEGAVSAGGVSPGHMLFTTDASPLSATAAHVYDGYAFADGKIAGTIRLKVGRANSRTGIAKFTATVHLLGGKKTVYSASTAVNASGPTAVTLTRSSGGTVSKLALTVAGGYMAGNVDGFSVEGARNQSAAKEARRAEYAAKSGRVVDLLLSASSATGAGSACANGYSALALKVLAKGKSKLSGVMSDGTKVSISGLQMLLNEDGSETCIPVLAPLYKGKRGGFGFLLWISRNGTLDVTNLSDWNAASSSAAPFTAALAFAGADPLTTPRNGTYSFSVDRDAFPQTIKSLPVIADLLPQELTVTARSGRLTAVQNSVTKLRISRTASTGLFKGSFAVYVQSGDRRKKKTVPFNGVFVNGTGYGAATVKGAGASAIVLR